MVQKYKKEEKGNNIAKSVNTYSGKSKKKKRSISTIAILCFILGVITGMVMGAMIAVLVLDKEEDSKNMNAVIAETENQKEENDILDNMSDEEGFLIETPFVDLYYPKKWENQVHVETVSGKSCIVQFFAMFEGKGKVQIFDIVFGGEEGYNLGYFENEKNKKIAVNIVSYDFELGKDWTSEEKDSIHTMMEDVNYLIDMLEKAPGFELIK